MITAPATVRLIDLEFCAGVQAAADLRRLRLSGAMPFPLTGPQAARPVLRVVPRESAPVGSRIASRLIASVSSRLDAMSAALSADMAGGGSATPSASVGPGPNTARSGRGLVVVRDAVVLERQVGRPAFHSQAQALADTAAAC